MVGHDDSNGVGHRRESDLSTESISPQNGRRGPTVCSPQKSQPSKAGDSFSPSASKDEEVDLPPIRNSSGVAFWNVNIPRSEWTDECPDYLQYAFKDHKDRGVLLTPDPEYQRQSWDEVQALTRGNRLDLFKRAPSQLRLYRAYCRKLIEEHGSIMNFVLKERLHWEDLKFSSSPPFTNADDFVILYNDWPYGVDERIIHLVVWTKFELPPDPESETGDMSAETRAFVNSYVDQTFVSRCGREKVIWFKNWGSLKSIHAIEHFHVMLFNPDMQFVREITHGDMPLFQKVKSGNMT